MAIKLKALSLDVWDYVDPTRDEPEVLKESISGDAVRRLVYPTQETPQSSEESLPQAPEPEPLSREEIEEESLTIVERERFCKLEKKYDRSRSGLNDFLNYLSNTVSIHYMNEAIRGDSVYEMMVILKQTLSPSENKRKYQLRAELEGLKKTRRHDLDRWISDWVQLARKFELQGRLDTEDVKLHFIRANQALDEVWAKQMEILMDEKDFEWLANSFRTHYRRDSPKQPRNPPGSFSTPKLQRKIENESQKSLKKCLCGRNHQFKDCYYLIPAKKPSDFN
jgi:hypothetical protein